MTRQIVWSDNIVDRRLCVRATLKRVFEGTAVRRHGTLKPMLFVRRWWRERGLKCFRGGIFGGHPTFNGIIRRDINLWNVIDLYAKERPYRDERRPVRETERLQRRERVHMERTDSRRLPRPRRRQDDRVGQTTGRSASKYPANRTRFNPALKHGSFLATAR
jgi:hypothetical protein